MADILIDNESAPATPAAGKSIIWVDSGGKGLVAMDDTGRIKGSLSRNDAVAAQGPGFAADTYITNSGLLIPGFGMKVGQRAEWKIALDKTAAGVAAVALTIRTGAAQTTADTSRLALTQGIAQAATATKGLMIVVLTVRSVGAGGVLAAGFGFTHPNFGDGADGASIGFDNTSLAGQYLGLSLNAGASAAWTLQVVSAELIG